MNESCQFCGLKVGLVKRVNDVIVLSVCNDCFNKIGVRKLRKIAKNQEAYTPRVRG